MTRSDLAERKTRSLTFRVGDRRLSVDASKVVEVVRAPRVTRVPHAPPSLLGIANIRGEPVPVIALGQMLGGEWQDRSVGGCIIVYEQGQRIGLMVDEVLQIGSDDSERINDLDARLAAEIRPASDRRQATGVGQGYDARPSEPKVEPIEARKQFLSMTIAGQSFAIALEDVHEVMALDDQFGTASPSENVILGMTDYHGSVLPIAAARSLLGLRSEARQAAAKIVVVEYRGTRVGLAVDSVQTILRLASSQIDAVPTVLKNGQGPAELEAIGRVGDGNSLVAILSTERLFGNQAVHRVATSPGEQEMGGSSTGANGEQFLIFALGSEEYGLPIRCVDEVVRVPATITRVPRAPSFVSGVVNLRGRAVPLIDQRIRFEVTDTNTQARQRAIIVTIDGMNVGFIVDRVSETIAIPAEDLLPAPDISERTSVFDRVARLHADGRMILLVNPKELLTRAEQDVVAAFAETDSEEKAS
ncbi:chemotaxis protein CheW [Ensifer canadensis]